MCDKQNLLELGASAAAALATQSEWIHRRVESITFPSPERPIYRRYISVDFTIPPGLRPIRASSAASPADYAAEQGADTTSSPAMNTLLPAPPTDTTSHPECKPSPVCDTPPSGLASYYVPVSLIRKWPPLSRLDLRDPDGRPIPFLTGKENAAIDAAALLGLAEAICRADALSSELKRSIGKIALGNAFESATALAKVLTAPPRNNDHAHLALQKHLVFRGLAQSMRFNTLLWLRVCGLPGTREIVKFSYDMPLDNRFRSWSKAAFGWGFILFGFSMPHVGASGSYHCNIIAPAPLEVLSAAMVFYECPRDAERPIDLENLIPITAKSTLPRAEHSGLSMFVGVAESQAKFYVSGDRDGMLGRLYVAVRVHSESLFRGAIVASGAATAVLALFVMRLVSVVNEIEAAVAVLLLSPIIFGSLLVRPLTHVLAGGYLLGTRRLIVAAAVPSAAAAAVIAASNGKTSLWLYACMIVFAIWQLAMTGVFFLGLKAGKRTREREKPHPDARLAETHDG